MSNNLPPCKTKQWTTKLTMRLCSVNLLAVSILACLPCISTLTLPSGDPAPGRSPGPPESELYSTVYTVENQTDVTTEMSEILDACAFARVPSESESVVTLSETDSEVNLTVGHSVFETEQLVRGVVYEVIADGCTDDDDIFDTRVDDIFSDVIGPVFNAKTPHSFINSTHTDKLRLKKLRTFNFKSLDDQMISTHKTRETEIIRTRNYATKAPKPTSKPKTPKPVQHTTYNKKDNFSIPNLLYPNPQNKKDLDAMLQQPVLTRPDFTQDVFNETTRRFNQIHEEFQKWAGLNISRRQAGVRLHPRLPLVREYNIGRLQKILAHFNITGDIPEDLIKEATRLYVKDHNAYERTLGLMAQFIYAAQNKFSYGQLLKERYIPTVRYRIGYSFAVLDTLLFQFNNGYYAISDFLKTGVNFKFEDEVMYLIKVYERCLKIHMQFYDVLELIRKLEVERIEKTEFRNSEAGRKDRHYIAKEISQEQLENVHL